MKLNTTFRRNICISIPKFGVIFGIEVQNLRRILELDGKHRIFASHF